MFHIVDGHHQALQMPASKALWTDDANDGKSPSQRDEKIDFSKMEPLNPNGYMYIFLLTILTKQHSSHFCN